MSRRRFLISGWAALAQPVAEVAPAITSQPGMLVAYIGSAISYLSGTASLGTPAATVVTQILGAGDVVLASGAGSSVGYTAQAGDVIRVRQTWSNAAGTATATSAPLAASAAPVNDDVEYTYIGLGSAPAARVDANGRVVLAKHTSARYVFVDTESGDDTWDGLAGVRQGSTTNGPLKTLYKALQVARHNFGDWVLLAKGKTLAAEASLQACRAPWGLNAEYPTLVSTYDQGAGPLDDVTWRDTTKYRSGTWTYTAASSITFNPRGRNGAGFEAFKHFVFENLVFLGPTHAGGGLTFAGSGDGVLIEHVRLYNVMFHLLGEPLLAHSELPLTNSGIRRSSIHKGGPQGHFSGTHATDFSYRHLILHGCGYSGDLRNSPGQSKVPTIREHGAYTYGQSPRFSRCIMSHNSSFGISARHGLSVKKSAFIRNGGGFIVAGASTDGNKDYGHENLIVDVQDNVISGLDYINGVDFAGGANGYMGGFSCTDETDLFRVRNNIAVDCAAPAGTWLAQSLTSTQLYLDTHLIVTFDTVANMSYNEILTRTADGNTYGVHDRLGGNTVILVRTASALIANEGDTFTYGAKTFTVVSSSPCPQRTFPGALPEFDGNITRNCGPSTLSLYTPSGAGGTVGPVPVASLTNNVVDNPAQVSGSNVAYETVAASYAAPLRNAETYAATLGYANSKAWMDYAVTRPDLDHCTPFLNYMRAGFNRAPV